MVGWATLALTTLAASDKQTLLERLDPERRVAVVLALIGLALLGVLLVTLILLAGRWVRHPAPRRPRRAPALPSMAAAVREGAREIEHDSSPGETLPGRSTSSETLHDRRAGEG